MPTDHKKAIIYKIISLAISFAAIFLIILIVNAYTDLFKPQETPTPTVVASEYPDYEIVQHLEREGKFVVLIDKAEDRGTGQFKNQVGGRTGWLIANGKFARAYLYANLSVNKQPISQFESLYVKINYIGGHLFRPDTLKTPPSNEKTALLYALRNVSYIANADFYSAPIGYSDTKPFAQINWLTYLNNRQKTSFATFFGSEIDGFVDLKIFYECSLETPDCSISREYGDI